MSSSRVVRVRTAEDGVAPQVLRDGIAEIQQELEVNPEFPPEVEEAAAAAAANPRLPDLDRTDLPMVTIDPEGAMDLDQALYLARTDDGGYVLYYAIADVAAFITPGDPVDLEAHRRGQTLYGADSQDSAAPDSRSPRAAARCCPTRSAPRCSGRSPWTGRASAPTSRWSGRGSGAGPSSTTRACRS